MFYEQLDFMRNSMRADSLSLDIFEMCLNSVISNSQSSLVTRSAVRLSENAAKHVVAMNDSVSGAHAFIFFMALQALAFFFVRSLLGVFVVLTMRYKKEGRNIGLGFVVYCSDLYGGVWYMLSGCLNAERFDNRRMLYSMLNVFFLYIDVRYSMDFFICRVIVFIVDRFVMHTSFGELPRYLKADMAGARFPQEGSHPWVAMADIMSFYEHVVKLSVENTNGNKWSGLGFLLSDGVYTYIYTVAHVLSDFDRLKYKSVVGTSQTILNCNEYSRNEDGSNGNDPVSYAFVGTECNGANVKLLESEEIKDVDSLFFVKLNGFMEPSLCWVSKFRFDREHRLRAAIDLEKGNSGGPAFAVLKDGTVRYAGATSAGEVTGRNGNHISCICQGSVDAGRVYESDAESIGSERGSALRSKASTKKQALRELATSLNRKVQSLHDQLTGGWFVDESRDGNEVQWVDNHSDIIGILEQYRDADPPKDCDEDAKKKSKNRKKKKLSFQENKEKTYSQLKDIWATAEKVLGADTAVSFMRDVRCGYKPHVSCDNAFAEFCPSSEKKVLFDTDEIKPENRFRKEKPQTDTGTSDSVS